MKIAMSKAEGKRSLSEMGEEDEEEEDDQLDAVNQEAADKKEKKKGKKAVFGREGTNSNLCQVENCMVDMSGAKHYHRRHKVCEFHAKAPVVRVSGLHQRYCQQCSRFHEIGEFDEAKRSCRRRLAGHNERRRKSSNECQRTEGSNRNGS